MAGEISFGGLSSGLDTNAIIQQLMRLERQPLVALERRRSDLEAQRTKLQDLASAVRGLETAAEALSTYDELALFEATSSDESVATAAIGGDAPAGTYQVEVTALAQIDRNYSAALGGGALGLADGDTLELTIDGEVTSVAFEAGDTLDDVASRINASGAAAWATVVGDGEGGGRLLVASEETGAAQHISFAGAAAELLDLSNVQLASDASAVIDGTVAVTSASNTLEGVIEGTSLSLAGPGTTEVTIEADTGALRGRIDDFVAAYNEVMTAIHQELRWTGEARTEANLSGDSTLRSIQSTLQRAVTSTVEGLAGEHTSLASVGITTDRDDGTLSVDEAALDAALSADPDAVKDLLARNPDTGTEGVASALVTAAEGAELSPIEGIIDAGVGSLSIRLDGIDQRTEAIDESLERAEARLVAHEERLRRQFLVMEQMISELQSQSGFLAGLGE